MAYHSRVTTSDEAITHLTHIGTCGPKASGESAAWLRNIIDDINVKLSARSD